ncbi:MAG: glucokinase [Polyangiaceae bacterium]
MVIVGDIGGTHARLALVAPSGRFVRSAVFESHKYPSLEAVLRAFLDTAKKPKPSVAVLGVAGPVVDGRCVATNLPWVVDARSLSRKVGIRRVSLLNDLVALSLGALGVPRARLRVLTGGGIPKKRAGNIAVIAAGTGLGEALLLWDRTHFIPSATEGGHAAFAPQDDVEVELLQFLRARFGHVSWERVLSGGGLGNIYDFFRQAKGVTESTANVEALAAAPDRNALISELGIAGKSDAAAHAVDLFATMYGAETGNLALKMLAVGGVYVCGNIAVQMLGVLERGGFARAFKAKGRLTPLMEKIPVAVVLGDAIGLAGAARVALGH